MAKASLMIPVPQMIDLALNSPEPGAVNYNILHTLLHVIVDRIGLNETRIEFRGSNCELMESLLVNTTPGPVISVNEYVIAKDEAVVTKTALKNASGQTVVFVEAVSQKEYVPQISVAIDKAQFDLLTDDIHLLKKDVAELKDVPNNSVLLDALRSKSTDQNNPVLEMFKIVSLSKRIDGIEAGLSKLGSIVEDLAVETQQTTGGAQKRPARHEKTTQGTEANRRKFEQVESQQIDINESRKERHEKEIQKNPLQKDDVGQGQGGQERQIDQQSQSAIRETRERYSGGVEDVDEKQRASKRPSMRSRKMESKSSFAQERKRYSLYGSDLSGSSSTLITEISKTTALKELKEKIEVIEYRVKILEKREPRTAQRSSESIIEVENDEMNTTSDWRSVGTHEQSTGTGHTAMAAASIGNAKEGINYILSNIEKINSIIFGKDDDPRCVPIEKRVTNVEEALKSVELSQANQTYYMVDKFNLLEDEFGIIAEKINLGGKLDMNSLMDLGVKIAQIQDALHATEKNLRELSDGMVHNEVTLKALNEQCESLANNKVNREEFEDALIDKADTCAVHRKVSHDQLDSVCDDMNDSIEVMVKKFKDQKLLWEQTLSALQIDIDRRICRQDLSLFESFINKKFKMVQQRLNHLNSLYKDKTAAGSISKILRDVHCISCNDNVVMSKQQTSEMCPKPEGLSASECLAAQIAYKVNDLRTDGAKETNLVNRYCGGSHTIITRNQRVYNTEAIRQNLYSKSDVGLVERSHRLPDLASKTNKGIDIQVKSLFQKMGKIELFDNDDFNVQLFVMF